MESAHMTRLLVIHLALLLLTSCGRAAAVKIETAAAQQPKLVSALPRQVDLTKIGHIAPKGRVQDLEYNQLPLVQELIAQGKQSVPYLISKLDDDMKIDGAVVDYWSDIRVGDVALIILTDFFTDSSWQRATIAGVGWDEFLERENRKSLTGEQVLHSYVAKHGRKKIKDRWIATWAQHSNGIYWDEKERCFRLTGS
jgi:hypothetical protein